MEKQNISISSKTLVIYILTTCFIFWLLNCQCSQETLTRNYPETIKGNWDPSVKVNEYMKNEVDNLKNLGGNTVSIPIPYRFNADGTYYLYEFESRVIETIKLIKSNGFTILVAPNFVYQSNMNFEDDLEIDMDLDQFLQLSKELALYWAKQCEQYKVEFFAPQNEIDHIIRTNIGDFNDTPTISQKTSAWHKEIVTELRNVFQGKIVAKLANIREQDDFTGYDYIGETVTITNFITPPDSNTFTKEIQYRYELLAQIAEKSQADWLVTEFWMPYTSSIWTNLDEDELEQLKEMKDEYYQIGTDEYLNFIGQQPKGFIFHPWLDIKGEPAEAIVKDFFSKI